MSGIRSSEIFWERAMPDFRFCTVIFIWQSRFATNGDVAREFGFDFFDTGEAALEFRG